MNNDRGNSDDVNATIMATMIMKLEYMLSFPLTKVRKISRIDPEVMGISKEVNVGIHVYV
jgi:hypothetical protein